MNRLAHGRLHWTLEEWFRTPLDRPGQSLDLKISVAEKAVGGCPPPWEALMRIATLENATLLR